MSSANSLLVGNGNLLTETATDLTTNAASNSALIGKENKVYGLTESLVLLGYNNAGRLANHSFAAGTTNTVAGPTPGSTTTWGSAAIGDQNTINATSGWAMGYFNKVTGSQGAALGSGLLVDKSQSVALGRFNKAMESNDVLVVGTGTGDATANRSTALRITTDGGVILGRAQGDIAMGDYGN